MAGRRETPRFYFEQPAGALLSNGYSQENQRQRLGRGDEPVLAKHLVLRCGTG